MPIKELSPTFEKILKFFKFAATKNTDMLRGVDGGALQDITQDTSKPGPNRYKPEEFNETFSRTSLKEDYLKARKFEGKTSANNGTVGEVVLVTKQHEFLSGLQRDYMARKMSRVQSVAIDAGIEELSSGDNNPIDVTIKAPMRGLLLTAPKGQ